MKTPRMPDPSVVTDTTDLARRFMVFASEAIHSFTLQPSIEARSIEVDGNFPISVWTRVRADFGVVRAQTFEKDNPAATIEDTSIAWRLSDDPREPGIVVDSMGGLTVGTVYTVKLLIFGSEAQD